MKSDVICTIKSESSYIKAKDGPTLIQESIDSKLASAPPRLARTGIMIIPRDTGHRVKDHIMKMIQNEVLDDKATKNIQSGIQTGSSRVGG